MTKQIATLNHAIQLALKYPQTKVEYAVNQDTFIALHNYCKTNNLKSYLAICEKGTYFTVSGVIVRLYN